MESCYCQTVSLSAVSNLMQRFIVGLNAENKEVLSVRPEEDIFTSPFQGELEGREECCEMLSSDWHGHCTSELTVAVFTCT